RRCRAGPSSSRARQNPRKAEPITDATASTTVCQTAEISAGSPKALVKFAKPIHWLPRYGRTLKKLRYTPQAVGQKRKTARKSSAGARKSQGTTARPGRRPRPGTRTRILPEASESDASAPDAACAVVVLSEAMLSPPHPAA